jgi:hypothetical protein
MPRLHLACCNGPLWAYVGETLMNIPKIDAAAEYGAARHCGVFPPICALRKSCTADIAWSVADGLNSR